MIKGLYGIRKNGFDKLSYNRYGSQPGSLGRDMVSFCRAHSAEEISNMYDGIYICDCDGMPDDRAIATIPKFLHREKMSISDWWAILLPFMGNLELLYQYMQTNGGIGYMVDSEDFVEITDSAKCRYAYIINLDTGNLEFWLGGQTTWDDSNRYGSEWYHGQEDNLYPCRLMLELSLSAIRSGDISVDECERMMADPFFGSADCFVDFIKMHDGALKLISRNAAELTLFDGDDDDEIDFEIMYDGTIKNLIEQAVSMLSSFDADEYAYAAIVGSCNPSVTEIECICGEAKSAAAVARELSDEIRRCFLNGGGYVSLKELQDVCDRVNPFLNYIDFKAEVEDGAIRLIDGQGGNLCDIEDERFYSASDIIGRLDVYWDDFFLVNDDDGTKMNSYEEAERWNREQGYDGTADAIAAFQHFCETL